MATYGFLVNKLIRKVNEVETTSATFNTAIGVTATAKDAIIDALDTIYNRKYKWPFMAVVQNVTIPLGATSMSFEADMLSVDWSSFIVMPEASTSFRGAWLQVLNTDEYYRYHMLSDIEKLANDPTNSGGNSPRYVVYTEDGGNKGYTVSPPNQTGASLTLTYKYYRKPVRPEAFDDEVDIPDEWQYVLMARALWYMYVFYDNNDRADRLDVEFKDAFKDMVTELLTNQNHHVYSGQVEQIGPNAFGSKYLR